MKLLDLFCCAGGAGTGYHRAGFKVEGVDITPQPNYPFKFTQADALDFLKGDLSEYTAIHASPPCQRYSWATQRWAPEDYPDLVEPVREALIASGKPYIIENVPGAPLKDPIRLCGEMFDLNVIRHRNFEVSFPVYVPEHKSHRKPIKREAADGSGRVVQRSAYCTVAGHGGESGSFKFSDWQDAMDMHWTTREELTEAIPPAYTEFIGSQLMRLLQAPVPA